MPDEEVPPTHAQRRFVSQSIASLYIALDDLHEDMSTTGSPNQETRQQLQSALATVIVQLRKWRDEDHVDYQAATPFDGGPDEFLNQLMEGDVKLQKPEGSREAVAKPSKQAAEIPLGILYQSALDVIDLCDDLGLTEPIDDSSETVYPDPVTP